MTTPGEHYPILEFDPSSQAVIMPVPLPVPTMPRHAILCCFRDVIAHLRRDHGAQVITTLQSDTELGPHHLYEVRLDGRSLTVFHPGVGAPLAAALLEEVIALGARSLIACGGGGVLDPLLPVGHLILPTAAIRDEGTSYHYLPPAREVAANAAGVAALSETLRGHDMPYTLGKTWTTDAFYRETPAKVARRRAEGCLIVEMEAAALFAVAQFRGVTLAQLLYAGGDSSGLTWDDRSWESHEVRERLFWLAAEACLTL